MRLSSSILLAGLFFTPGGKEIGPKIGSAQEPKVVVAQVQVVGGYGSLSLSETFQSNAHRTSPISDSLIYISVTRRLTDSTGSVYSYSYSLADQNSRIVIKSSGGASDTGTVTVIAIVR
jgi:hypothetical protein